MKSKFRLKRCLLFMLMLLMNVRLLTGRQVEADELVKNQNILVINSYHPNFAWTRDQTEGITRTLTDSGYNFNISIEYMDWKNYNSEENLRFLYDYYKYKYESKIIDLIITTDDTALKFALEYRNEIFSRAPVVFSGINREGVDTIVDKYDRVTGVIEEIDPVGTLELALRINPLLNNVYLVYDNTESGLSTGHLVTERIKGAFPDINIEPCNNMTFQELIDTVRTLKNDSIVLVTTYSMDVNHIIMEMDYANSSISEYSTVPVYQLYDFGLNHGAIGGNMLSGRRQGEHAGALALQILEGKAADELLYIIPDSTSAVIDFKQMERFGIEERVLPSNIEIINRPFSFYETYKLLVWGVIITISVLIAFISILLFYIDKIHRMKKSLSENHEELTQLYEELTASDEEMKQQYDEIITINEKIRLSEEKLSYLAYHDLLTGLPNKHSLYEDAERILVPRNGSTALLFIDIDNFKNVNDTMGHPFGDLLIQSVGHRLVTLLGRANPVYRLGGDEFIVILQDISDMKGVRQIASGLLQGFTTEFDIQGSILHVSISIGIALYPANGHTLDELLKQADIAMYRVKESGKKNFMLYNTLMNELLMERVNIEKYLPGALSNHELSLHYQPQFDLGTGRITGFEALLRWKSPELGNVSPLRFIKIAEDTRMIIGIGNWVLESACRFLKLLNDMGYRELMISVNISIIQLLQPGFSEMVCDIIKRSGIEPQFLELEITESILMESIDSIGAELRKLDNKKVSIALDDFGKGYSSLNYLNQLPISTLKIDKSFIDFILNNKDNSLTGQIVNLGKCMGMSVVAEGVEQQEQLEYLKAFACDKIQGYLFSRPVPEAEVIALLQSR